MNVFFFRMWRPFFIYDWDGILTLSKIRKWKIMVISKIKDQVFCNKNVEKKIEKNEKMTKKIANNDTMDVLLKNVTTKCYS